MHRVDAGPRMQLLLLDMSAEEFAADLSSVDDLAESGLYSLLVDKPSQEEDGGVSMICWPILTLMTLMHRTMTETATWTICWPALATMTAMNRPMTMAKKRWIRILRTCSRLSTKRRRAQPTHEAEPTAVLPASNTVQN